MTPSSNVEIFLSDEDGRVDPASIRRGHNVFTDIGRNWLQLAVAWESLGVHDPASGADAAFDSAYARFRWIGVGSGYQPEYTTVQRLVSAISITAAPTYMKTLGTLTRPTPFSVRYTTTFSGADFAHHGASITLSEVAVLPDYNDGGGTLFDPALSFVYAAAYRSFDPLIKPVGSTLTVIWEFRF
jgi:hypothetical protein